MSEHTPHAADDASPSPEANIFTVGGTVQAGGGVYISRLADDELLELCRAKAFAYILTARQMGKSSIMVRAAEQLATENIKSVIVDLSKIGANSQITSDQWFLGLLFIIKSRLNLKTNLLQWWRANEHLSQTQRLVNFFVEVLLVEVSEPVIIFIDEIDTTINLPFTDDFYVAIRSLYNERMSTPSLRRLSFVLIGVATPSELIQDARRTPFNIGQRVDLADFTFDDALPLAAGLNLASDEATRDVLRSVLKWTNGHPYLTQRLFRRLVETGEKAWTEADIDRAVAETFFGEMSVRDNNLQFVRDMLTKRAPDITGVLTIYREVLRGRQPVPDEEQSIIKSHLKLSGVVKREDGALVVRNEIYRRVFGEAWIKEHLPVNWTRRLTRVARAAALIFLVMLLPLAVIAWVQRGNALDSAAKAEESAEQERAAKEVAQDAMKEAIEQRAIADEQRTLADEQKTKAVNLAKNEGLEKEKAIKAAEGERQAKEATRAALIVAEDKRREAEEQRRVAESERERANKLASAATAAADDAREAEAAALDAQKRAVAAEAEAKRLGKIVSARLLAKQANELSTKDGQNELALLLATESMKRYDSVDADGVLRRGIQALGQVTGDKPRSVQRIRNDAPVNQIAYSAGGDLIATASADNVVRVTRVEDGKEVFRLPDTKVTGNIGLTPSPSFFWDTLLAIPSGNNLILVNLDAIDVNQPRGSRPDVLRLPLKSPITALAFSPYGGYVASASGTDVVITDVAKVADAPRVLSHDERTVTALAFSSDGSFITTASSGEAGSGSVVQTWNPASGQKLGSFSNDASQSNLLLAISPDDQFIATVSTSGILQVRRILGGGIIADLTLTDATRTEATLPQSLRFSPDGRYLALAIGNRTLLWRVNFGGDVFRESEPSRSQVTDDGRGASQTQSKQSGAPQPQQQQLPYDAWETTPQTQRPVNNALIALEPLKHDGKVTSLAFSPDGRFIATSSLDKTAALYELATGKRISGVQHQGGINAVVFSPDSKNFATAGRDNTAQLWDFTAGREIVPLQHEGDDPVQTVAFSPDGENVATGTLSGKLHVWSTGAGIRKHQPYALHTGAINSVKYSPDGKMIVTAGQDKVVRVWSVRDGVSLDPKPKEMRGHTDVISSAAFDENFSNPFADPLPSANPFDNSELLVTAGRDGKIYVWNLDTNESRLVFAHVGDDQAGASGVFGFNSAVWNPQDNHIIAFAGDDGTINIFDWQTRTMLRTLDDNADLNYAASSRTPIVSLAWSPNGKLLAAGKSDGSIVLWQVAAPNNLETNLQFTKLQFEQSPKHDRLVRSVTFSTDSNYLASASDDQTARIWKLFETVEGKMTTTVTRGGKEFRIAREVMNVKHDASKSTAAINAVAFGESFANNGQFCTGASDGTARLWLWQPIDLVAEACSRLTRNLSESEWRAYMLDEERTCTCDKITCGEGSPADVSPVPQSAR
ncbi:MAG: AAA-like domain-containing protein [Pyrinomonadaceae bacterium MAG19_C2-C3]|nr:AAA-like domain-containing protein [Pyrinomonadaceae bacterium MAG19_C2-C3]